MWYQQWSLDARAWGRAGVEAGGWAEMTGSEGRGTGGSGRVWVVGGCAGQASGKPHHPNPAFPSAAPHLLDGVGFAGLTESKPWCVGPLVSCWHCGGAWS